MPSSDVVMGEVSEIFRGHTQLIFPVAALLSGPENEADVRCKASFKMAATLFSSNVDTFDTKITLSHYAVRTGD